MPGVNCEHDVDDCDPNPCENEGVCRDGTNSYSCTCAAGYAGLNCTEVCVAMVATTEITHFDTKVSAKLMSCFTNLCYSILYTGSVR